ncbi:MAG: TIGR00341 family protein, partial [Bacteroidaceae bacterium]|nr:TIGR00341 family protein [Bacteroidaceae bacterium]
RKYIIWVVVLTMIPAIYLTIGILNDTIYEGSVNRFVNEQLSFENAQVVDKKVEKKGNGRELRVVLVGREVPDSTIMMAQRRMADYNLQDTRLVVLQGVSGQQGATMDITSVRAQVLEDFYKNGEVKLQQQAMLIDSLQGRLSGYLTYDEMARALMPEMKVLYPQVRKFSLSRALEMNIDSTRIDTITFAVLQLSKRLDDKEKAKMVEWMKARTNSNDLRLLLEQ